MFQGKDVVEIIDEKGMAAMITMKLYLICVRFTKDWEDSTCIPTIFVNSRSSFLMTFKPACT